MPDRVLRDEVWQSDRFLDLPTDAARLAFIRMVSMADDFGNLEGSLRQMFRVLHVCTQVKTEEAAAGVLDSLLAADLIRGYSVGDRQLFHIPRFRHHKQYQSRRFPCSPWCDANAPLGKVARAAAKQALA